jgi:hypothetical protein
MGYEGNMVNQFKTKNNIERQSQYHFNDCVLLKKTRFRFGTKPIKTDSLALVVTKDNYKKDFCIKIKEQKKTYTITSFKTAL